MTTHPSIFASFAPSLIALRMLAMLVGSALCHSAEACQTPASASATAGFEDAETGAFDRLDSPLGVWIVDQGLARIDNQHSKSGKQCLQLTGGERTTVTLELATSFERDQELVCWAERWTSRQPFVFRVEAWFAGDWHEIYDGDTSVRVGRAFLNQLRIPVPARTSKLRFTVSSPPNTGILIDDMRFEPAQPQRVVAVEQIDMTLPAIVGGSYAPLLKLNIQTEGSLQPISLTELQTAVTFTGNDVKSVQVFVAGPDQSFSDAKPFAQPIETGALRSGEGLSFSGNCSLSSGENFLWVACQIHEEARLDHSVSASCNGLAFSSGESRELQCVATQRFAVSLRDAGDDGIHTYRIPGLATTKAGTLIAVYDVRRRSGGDLPGDIDVGMSRSTDGGLTWQPMRIIMNMGDDPKWRYDGVGDPAILVDQVTGTIWVAATWSHGNRSWHGSGPGLEPSETGQLLLVRSQDDGQTWSDPINITKQVKDPSWSFVLQGPGKGITMLDGTLVFAAQYQDPPNTTDPAAHRLPHSTILYSKDHGDSWSIGNGAYDDTTEAQVIEVEPGVLMLNCRYNRKSTRVVMTTSDLGRTWEKHPTSERSLIEPRACMASLIDVDRETEREDRGWLLFSNPNSTRARDHITIKASTDRGLTWPKDHRLLLDEGRGAGYSCMSMIDAQTVGILYEGSQSQLTFQRISLRDIVQPVPAQRRNSQTLNKLLLPKTFGDHMVLQADAELPIFGQAGPGRQVTVRLGNEDQTTTADGQGAWSVRFAARPASHEPISLAVHSENESIEFSDVLIGEVWICAGQSNMEWMLSQSTNGPSELASARHPALRLLHLHPRTQGSSIAFDADQLQALTPEEFLQGEWKVATAESARSFSAVAWYFGRSLQSELDVPIGLICPAIGGTPTESWIPRESLRSTAAFEPFVSGNWLDNPRLSTFCRTRGEQNLLSALQAGESIPGDSLGSNHPFKPGFLWDAGISRILPYAMRGVIWYQGESNAESASRAGEHAQLLRLMIQTWRSQWGQGDFPFLYVQLPALQRPHWPLFREGQRRLLAKEPNLAMAISIDTGHPSNVHPPLKSPIGERLARCALGTVYQSDQHATFTGPLLSATRKAGDCLNLRFVHTGSGLKSSDGAPLRHFEVCGADGVFYSASAKIVSNQSITLHCQAVPSPCQARYAWSPYPDPPVNLVNSDGLPASPFISDEAD